MLNLSKSERNYLEMQSLHQRELERYLFDTYCQHHPLLSTEEAVVSQKLMVPQKKKPNVAKYCVPSYSREYTNKK